MTRLDKGSIKSFCWYKIPLISLLVFIFSLGFPNMSSSAQAVFNPSDINISEQDFLEEYEEICGHNCFQNSVEKDEKNSFLDLSKPITNGKPNVKKVALTFDDGPYTLTDEYLKILQQYDVPASFFLLGMQVDKYPEKAKNIVDLGFEVGIHSYAHKQLTKMTSTSVNDDLVKSLKSLKNATGIESNLFRPPYGAFNKAVIETAQKHDLATVLWNVDPRDWDSNSADSIANHVIEHTQDGSIILLHEGRDSTLKALPKIIHGLRERGFEIVFISELLSSHE